MDSGPARGERGPRDPERHLGSFLLKALHVASGAGGRRMP